MLIRKNMFTFRDLGEKKENFDLKKRNVFEKIEFIKILIQHIL